MLLRCPICGQTFSGAPTAYHVAHPYTVVPSPVCCPTCTPAIEPPAHGVTAPSESKSGLGRLTRKPR